MFVGPVRWKQNQLASLGCDFYILVAKLGFASGTRHIIQIPDCNQLSLGKLVTAAIDVPLIEFTGTDSLYRVAHVFECVPKNGYSRLNSRRLRSSDENSSLSISCQ